MLYEQYGYYGDKVTSFVLPGKDGLEKMQSVMKALRDNPPGRFGGVNVAAAAGLSEVVRTRERRTAEALTLPKSNVLYFELEGRRVDLRASQRHGTEDQAVRQRRYRIARGDAGAA